MTTAADPQYVALLQQLQAPDLPEPERVALVEQLHARYLELREINALGGVATNGLPYPLPTDPLAAGADAIRALAEALAPTQYREFAVRRDAVPAGTVLFALTVTAKAAPISDPVFGWTYTSGDAGFVLIDPGFYLITASVLIDWANAGAGAMIQLREGASTMVAVAPYGGVQTTTLSTLYYSDGVKKLYLEGVHNSGTSRNLDGTMRIVRVGTL
jgi:hypothetical protein